MADPVERRVTSLPGSAELAAIQNLNNLIDDFDSVLTGSLLLSEPGLDIGTSSAAEVAHGDLIYMLNGVRYFIAADEVGFTATTHDIADPDSDPREAIYVLSVDDQASVNITKGTTAAEDAAVAPATPAGELAIGQVKIQHNGSAIFDATSNDLDAAHLTTTFTDAALFVRTAAKVQQNGSDV